MTFIFPVLQARVQTAENNKFSLCEHGSQKKEFREKIDVDNKEIDAMLMIMKKPAPQFSKVRKILKSFGLL